MPPQIFARRDEREGFLVVKKFTREVIKKLRPLIPPVAEQFRVIRRDGERRTIQKSGELPCLVYAFVEKMPGMSGGGRQRGIALINFLVPRAAGDAVILDAREPPIVR